MDKIILPEEIVEYIISFTCDRRGYNMVHYNQRKICNTHRMFRLRKEIKCLRHMNYSIAWLRPSSKQSRIGLKAFKKSLKDGNPTISYHTGCFGNLYEEEHSDFIY